MKSHNFVVITSTIISQQLVIIIFRNHYYQLEVFFKKFFKVIPENKLINFYFWDIEVAGMMVSLVAQLRVFFLRMLLNY